MPLLCGHRGHCVGAPENTLAAFRLAKSLGASDCEIDTVMTADGEIVVLHDLSVDRTSNGRGVVSQMSAADVAALDAGSWFGAAYAGEKIPTLTAALDLAKEIDLGFEIEIKEVRNIDGFLARLTELLADPDVLARVHLISFDHVVLREAKQRIAGIRTGGILHERLADPVGAARAAQIDRLCIDLDRFDPAQAREIKAAGISIRCHAFTPAILAEADRAGLAWRSTLATALREDLVDTVSSDDVGWARDVVQSTLGGAGPVRD